MATANQILKAIQGALDNFDEALPAIEKELYEKIVTLVKELESSGDKILASAKNIRILGKVKNELQKLLSNGPYAGSVQDFLESYNTIANLQIGYFSQFVEKYKPAKILPIIRDMAIDTTANDLLAQGMNEGVLEPIMDILRQNITTGGSYASFTEQLRSEILSGNAGPGRLIRWSRQIAVDAINQYAAQHNAAIAMDLNFEWGRYVGSLIETSREFCEHLTKKEFIHKSELPEIIKGMIDGHQCRLNKKTELPLGMIDGTNPENFPIRRGGYLCRHQFFWIPGAAVPAELRNKFKGK